ncbi:hypothetical protein [Kitasatospora arboriphila]|uniref:Uncharacterized protein n=1 Tax=Kitasatospora arboriphila TaxID=258052 RepID=A0ABP4EA26_9ACTN
MPYRTGCGCFLGPSTLLTHDVPGEVLTDLAILLGLELDAELVREQAIRTGSPCDDEPYVEPRRHPHLARRGRRRRALRQPSPSRVAADVAPVRSAVVAGGRTPRGPADGHRTGPDLTHCHDAAGRVGPA